MPIQRLRRNKNLGRLADSSGTVTAELALALPAVSLVLAVTLGAFGLQIERMKLVSVAATAARALARGELNEEVRALSVDQLPNVELRINEQEQQICVTATLKVAMPALPSNILNLEEQQCARSSGL
ncbi:MAG: hypothetical protein RLZZ229_114 [Actinomycetota bacterium]|jgi:hypothetical protein